MLRVHGPRELEDGRLGMAGVGTSGGARRASRPAGVFYIKDCTTWFMARGLPEAASSGWPRARSPRVPITTYMCPGLHWGTAVPALMFLSIATAKPSSASVAPVRSTEHL